MGGRRLGRAAATGEGGGEPPERAEEEPPERAEEEQPERVAEEHV